MPLPEVTFEKAYAQQAPSLAAAERSVKPVENAESRCAARARADRRQYWGFGRSAGGCAEGAKGQILVVTTEVVPMGLRAPPLAWSNHLVFPDGGFHRLPKLLSRRGPVRQHPETHTIVSRGDTHQPLPQLLQLMGLQAAFEHAPRQRTP